MNCEGCKHFKETYPGKGYCRFWDMYVKAEEECSDGEDSNEI